MKVSYQEPEIPIDSEKDIVLWQTDAEQKKTVEFEFDSSCHGEARIIDGDLDISWSGKIPTGRKLRLELGPGKYRIDAVDARCGKRFEVLSGTEEVVYVKV